MLKKILVPLDGSKRAETILPYVQDLVRGNGKAQIVLLQVVEPVPAMQDLASPVATFDPGLIDRIHKQGRGYLERLQTRLKKKGMRAHVHVLLGPVVATIVDLAVRENCDLIALASHGRSGLPTFFYGSVAAGVLHRTDRPLFIVRSV
jgi:nucleotide-binding universal stress UspA family protein